MISPCSESPELRFWAACLKSKISAHSQANPTINSRGPKISSSVNQPEPTHQHVPHPPLQHLLGNYSFFIEFLRILLLSSNIL